MKILEHFREPIAGNCNHPIPVDVSMGGGTRPCRAPGSYADGKCYHHTDEPTITRNRKRQKLHRTQHAAAATHAYPVTVGMVMRMPVKEYLLLGMVAEGCADLAYNQPAGCTCIKRPSFKWTHEALLLRRDCPHHMEYGPHLWMVCDTCNRDMHQCHFCGESLRHDGQLIDGGPNPCYEMREDATDL